MDAVTRCAVDAYDLLVVDVHTREFDGIAACRELRGVSINPLLLLDHGADERDIIAAYEAGVDEYIARPIGLSLLVCKVRAWLRHSQTIPSQALRPREAASLRLNPEERQVVVGDKVVPLTNLELRLLHVLMAHEGQILSSEQIVPRVWGHHDGDKGLLKNVVYRLRRKIETDPDAPRYLHTVSGKGYLFMMDAEEGQAGEPPG